MKKIVDFWGFKFSLPLGLCLCLFYWHSSPDWLPYIWKGYKEGLDITDVFIMLAIFFSTILIFFFDSVRQYLFDGKRDFSTGKKNRLTEKSEDKIKAQNEPVPKQYRSKTPDGFTIGRQGKDFIRFVLKACQEHFFIIGAPGAFKSAILKNALIENFNRDKSVTAILAADVKPELSRDTVYEGRNDVKVLNPSIIDENRYGFNLYFGLIDEGTNKPKEFVTDDVLIERFSMISRSIVGEGGGDNAFFYEVAADILLAALCYGFWHGYSPGDTTSWVKGTQLKDVIAEIKTDTLMIEHHPKIVRLVSGFDEDDTSNAIRDIGTTLRKNLSIFEIDSVRHFFSMKNPKLASPVDLTKGISLFVALPDHLLDTYRCIFRIIWEVSINYLMSLPEPKRPEDRKSYWLLIDEAGSIGKVPNLESALARGRSKGIVCTIIGQAYSQFEATYSSQGAKTIMDSCKMQLILSCYDSQTSKMFSERFGRYRETKLSKQMKRGSLSLFKGTSGESESTDYMPIMDVSDINALEKDGKVMVFAKGDRFICDKAPYFQIPENKKISDKIKKQNTQFYPD